MPSSNVLIAVEEMREEVMDLIGVYFTPLPCFIGPHAMKF
jgi:hypothetical protein